MNVSRAAVSRSTVKYHIVVDATVSLLFLVYSFAYSVELGHIMKHCPQEREDWQTVKITCWNCDEEGHHTRNCKKPRKARAGGPKTCRNCDQPGHMAADCTEPRSTANVECNICNESKFGSHLPFPRPFQSRNFPLQNHHSNFLTGTQPTLVDLFLFSSFFLSSYPFHLRL